MEVCREAEGRGDGKVLKHYYVYEDISGIYYYYLLADHIKAQWCCYEELNIALFYVIIHYCEHHVYIS